MTTLLASRPPSLFDPVVGEPMLDDLVSGAWEGLNAHRSVSCPVCGEQMKPEYGIHALPLGGVCGGCGSTLR